MIKTIFIDIDNTLLDFNESSKLCIKQAFHEQDLPVNENTFTTFKTINDGLWLKIEKGELDRPGLHKIRFNLVLDALGLKGDGCLIEKRFREILFDTAVAVDGAKDLLKYLSSKYKVYAASNAIYLQQINRLTKTEMLEYLSDLFISEKLGVTKPSKEFFDVCIKGANTKIEETVMIGDSLSADIIGAKKYGLTTVWYNHNKEDVANAKCADYIVNSLQEIKQIL
jgi:YjjG family noncanonical pyrimidine nucleotidase